MSILSSLAKSNSVTCSYGVRVLVSYLDALSMVSSGKVNAKRLITHKFKLEETIKAFETTLSGQGIKVMIYCQKE